VASSVARAWRRWSRGDGRRPHAPRDRGDGGGVGATLAVKESSRSRGSRARWRSCRRTAPRARHRASPGNAGSSTARAGWICRTRASRTATRAAASSARAGHHADPSRPLSSPAGPAWRFERRKSRGSSSAPRVRSPARRRTSAGVGHSGPTQSARSFMNRRQIVELRTAGPAERAASSTCARRLAAVCDAPRRSAAARRRCARLRRGVTLGG